MILQCNTVPECRCYACNDLANFSIGNQDNLPKLFRLVWVFNGSSLIIHHSCQPNHFISAWRLILHTPGPEIPHLAYHIHSLLRLLTQLLTLLRHMMLHWFQPKWLSVALCINGKTSLLILVRLLSSYHVRVFVFDLILYHIKRIIPLTSYDEKRWRIKINLFPHQFKTKDYGL